MIILRNDELTFRFPEVHEEAHCSIRFQRTLRLPDDNREYPLPPGLGGFPLHHVDDYSDRLPSAWEKRGGVFLPMYQAEALWLNFTGDYPMALKVATGKICALTGEPWSEELVEDPQNYLVISEQPWLDGFAVGRGRIRQFVAMPLGEGYSAEEQLTGAARHGGLQIAAYPMKGDVYRALFEEEPDMAYSARSDDIDDMPPVAYSPAPDMGLVPGGLMRQEIYEDEYEWGVWDLSVRSRCFVHLLNSVQYRAVTGTTPPSAPPSAADYTAAGLPWFDYYADDLKALEGSATLAGLDSLAAKKIKQGEGTLDDNASVQPQKVVKLQDDQVREGDF